MGGSVSYEAFLASKHRRATETGFTVNPEDLPASLFPHQRFIIELALRRGRSAVFAGCGLGKSLIELAWAEQVYRKTLKPVLILTPLAVARQMRTEGEKFGIAVRVCRNALDVRPGVNVTNYEMLKEFGPSVFGGVVLDEAGILKNYTGGTRQRLQAAWERTPYKLEGTATPSPNDHTELGQHAEFLAAMDSSEMLARWFINDTMQAGNYRLKAHAAADFWQWVSSWAVACSKPSDLGFPDDGYELPPLHIHTHVVEVDLTADTDGALFRVPRLSSTGMHTELRRTLGERAAQIADLVHHTPGAWVLWANTNDEADELRRRIPEAVEVRGSDPLTLKEERLEGFAQGAFRVLVTKGRVAAFGLNWQHCHQMAFMGLDYSFEKFYQAVRRMWRFGQQRPVSAHVVVAETELPILESVQRKQADHSRMQAEMVAAMRSGKFDRDALTLTPYNARQPIRVPAWLQERIPA